MKTKQEIIETVSGIAKQIEVLELAEKVNLINELRRIIHEVSPFKSEPVDLLQWVPCDTVGANEYNPNEVAPVEMELLRLSINHDGYTSAVVSMLNEDKITRVVIDGAHRSRCGKEYPDIKERVLGYLPVVTIRSENEDLANRMSATVRHNRARGKHKVESMSDIVIELKKRNWNDAKIAKHLGMDADEVLRLTQITGLAEMFKDREFSQSWEIVPEEVEITEIADEVQ